MLDTKKEIPLGKVNIRKYWGDTSCRKSDIIKADILIQQDGCGNLRPIISATIYDDEDNIILNTFNLNELKDIPELQTVPIFKYLLEIQNTFKDVIAIGTPEQIACVRKGFIENRYPSLNYMEHLNEQKEYLKENNLLTVKLQDGTSYVYGTGLYNGLSPVTSYYMALIKTIMGWN
jgi:hypothetical protein